MQNRPTVIVYFDGFALYKALLQRTHPEYKWLDLVGLASLLFPQRDVIAVKFFTAQLKPLTNNPKIAQRQLVYWDALRATGVEIIEGKFRFNRQWLPYHPERLDSDGRVETVCVKRPEEKGTDVALASHLILDAIDNKADSYAIATNDSDLAGPVQMLSERGKSIALISVAGTGYNKAFDAAGIETVRQVRRGTLAAAQLPHTVRDQSGRAIKKPATWV